nr:hydrogenase maturation nickel metallochaperone HypA [Propionibacterium sp.]
MHELGLLTSVVAAVTRAAERAGATAVDTVALRVGTLSGAVPEALLGSWPLASAGTVVEGAALVIESVPAAVWCGACSAEREVDAFFALVCPVCGTPTGRLLRGREFEVAWVDLTTPEPG